MTWKQLTPISGAPEHAASIRSPFLVAPIALAVLAFTVLGLSAPYMQFDLTTKIQTSLLH